MRKNKFYILHFTFYIIFIPILLNLFGCSSTTETPTGELSGIVHLENQEDNSGIIIALYELATLDTTITRINNQYPHIGIKITQHTEFDHRFQSPVKYTETDTEGNFLIEKIPVGEYNVVALKDSFGFKYLLEVEINKGDNLLADQIKKEKVRSKKVNIRENRSFNLYPLTFNPSNRTSDLVLYAEHHLSGDITDDWVFETDHHYIIGEEGANSTNFTPGTNLEIQPGAIIRIEPANDLKIYGNLFAQGEENNMFWITTNDGFALTDFSSNFQFSIFNFQFDRSEEFLQYNSLELSSISSVSDGLIEWGKFDLANTGLLNQVNNLHMQNGIFRDSQCGFYSTGVDSTFCSNLLSEAITNDSNAGIYFNQVSNGVIEKNMINECENGIKIKTYSNPVIKNNCIINFNIGVVFMYNSLSEIFFNEFLGGFCCMSILSNSHPTIFSNNLNADIGIYNYYTYINIHNNNINCEIYAIQLEFANYGIGVDIDAVNNYYYTINEQEIQDLIHDKNDFDEFQQEHIGEVFYNPFLIQEVSNSGIQ